MSFISSPVSPQNEKLFISSCFPLILPPNPTICGKWKMCFPFMHHPIQTPPKVWLICIKSSIFIRAEHCTALNYANIQRHYVVYNIALLWCNFNLKYVFFTLRMRWEYGSQLNKKTHLRPLKTASDSSTRCLHILAHMGPLTETRSFLRWGLHSMMLHWSSHP